MKTRDTLNSRRSRMVSALAAAAFAWGTVPWSGPVMAGPAEDAAALLQSQTLLTPAAFGYQTAGDTANANGQPAAATQPAANANAGNAAGTPNATATQNPAANATATQAPATNAATTNPAPAEDLWKAVKDKLGDMPLKPADQKPVLDEIEKLIIAPDSRADMVAGEAVLKDFKGKAAESAARVDVLDKIRQLRAMAARPVEPMKENFSAEDAKRVDDLVLELVVGQKAAPQDSPALKKTLAVLAKRVSDRETIASRVALAARVLDFQSEAPAPATPPRRVNPIGSEVTLHNTERQAAVTLMFERGGERRKVDLAAGQSQIFKFETVVVHWSGKEWKRTPLSGSGTIDFAIQTSPTPGEGQLWVATFRPVGQPATAAQGPAATGATTQPATGTATEPNRPQGTTAPSSATQPQGANPSGTSNSPAGTGTPGGTGTQRAPNNGGTSGTDGAALDRNDSATIASGFSMRPAVSMLMAALVAQAPELRDPPKGWVPNIGTAESYLTRWNNAYPTKIEREGLSDVVEYAVKLSQRCVEAASNVAPDPNCNEGLMRCQQLMDYASDKISELMTKQPNDEERAAMQVQQDELGKIKLTYELVKRSIKTPQPAPVIQKVSTGSPEVEDLRYLFQLLDDRLREAEAKVTKLEGNTEESQYYTNWTKLDSNTYTGKYYYMPHGGNRPYTQTVFYHADRPEYVYFYSCVDNIYWGRHRVGAPAGECFEWATTRSSHPSLLTFRAPGAMPQVPRSNYSGQRIQPPTLAGLPIDSTPSIAPSIPPALPPALPPVAGKDVDSNALTSISQE